MVSGTDSPGEGEFKMFQMVKDFPADESCLVIGSDADLILFGNSTLVLTSQPFEATEKGCICSILIVTKHFLVKPPL
jgi:hypothetical protein